MTSITTKPDSLQPEALTAPHLFDDWFDPIETEVRGRVRQFIEELIRGELDEAPVLSGISFKTTPAPHRRN
jgi:putative transposase